MPRDSFGNEYHITLKIGTTTYGFNLYPDISAYGELDISDFAPRVSSGALGYRDLSIWQVWAMEDWRHGFGQAYFTDESAYAKSGEGIDTRHKGIIQLATALTASDTADIVVNKFVDFNSKVYAGLAANGGVRVYTPGTDLWAATTETTGTVNDAINIGSYLLMAPNGARVRKMGTDSAWSNAGNNANPPTDIGILCLHGGYLWASEDGDNWLHYAAEEDASDLEGSQDTDTNAIQAGAGDVPIVNMISYGGQLYVAREDALGVIDDANNFRMLENFTPERHSSNFQAMCVWRGALYFTIRNRIYKWAGSTFLDVTPSRYSEDYPYYTYGDFKNLTPHGNWMYVRARDNEDTYHEALLAYDGVGWHKLHDVTTESYVMNALALSPVTDKLWLNYTGATDTSAYIPLQALSDLPYASYPITGNHYWYSSRFDAGFKDVDKVFWKIRVRTNNCSATQTIAVDYDIDNSGTWTNVGEINVSPYQELDFPSPVTNTTYGKFLQFRFNFETATVAQTPVMESFACLYLLRPVAVWGWQLPLILASIMPTLEDGYELELTAEDIANQLRTARDQKTPLVLTDMWENTHNVYLSAVRFRGGEWRAEDDHEGIAMIAQCSLTEA